MSGEKSLNERMRESMRLSLLFITDCSFITKIPKRCFVQQTKRKKDWSWINASNKDLYIGSLENEKEWAKSLFLENKHFCTIQRNKFKNFLIFALYLSRPDFNVKVVPLVGDLEDFGPGKSVDPQPVSVDEEATRTNSQHYLHSFRVLQQNTPRS